MRPNFTIVVESTQAFLYVGTLLPAPWRSEGHRLCNRARFCRQEFLCKPPPEFAGVLLGVGRGRGSPFCGLSLVKVFRVRRDERCLVADGHAQHGTAGVVVDAMGAANDKAVVFGAQ
jgi:hypothetical protein